MTARKNTATALEGSKPTRARKAAAPAKKTVAKKAPAKKTAAKAVTGRSDKVARHIVEAFTGKPVGTFLTVTQIKNYTSKVYEGGHPSPGAVHAALFRKEGIVLGGKVQGAKGKGAGSREVFGATRIA